MAKATFTEKLRYNFDNTLSKGPIAIISWLALVTFLLVIIAGFILFIFGLSADPVENKPFDLVEGIWQSLMRVLDAGTTSLYVANYDCRSVYFLLADWLHFKWHR
jgi:hypothetical protein